MALADQYDLAADAIWRKRVQMAAVLAAYSIAGGPHATSGEENKRARTLAREILRSPAEHLDALSLALASSVPSGDGSSLTDEQLETRAGIAIRVLAGVDIS